jgi:ketosteroid isomerase-like protein
MTVRNRLVVLLLCSALCLSSTALAKDKKSAGGAGGEDQVKALLEQSRQAALKGDSSYLEQNAAEDYSRVNPDGKLVSKSDAVNALKSGDVKYESIETSDMKVRVWGDTAVATYTADVKGTNKGQDASGKHQVTRVFVKQGGKWREVAFHVTKVA